MNKYIEVIVIGVLLAFGIFLDGFNAKAESDKGIYYDNVNYSDNVKLNNVDGMNIDYSAELLVPGDFYELTFDVVNESLYDVSFADINLNKDDKYIHYELTYNDGSTINIGDVVKKGEKKQLKYKVLYKKLVLEDYEFDTAFYLNFEQA